MRSAIARHERAALAAVLLLGLLIRLPLAAVDTHVIHDVRTFEMWARTLVASGPVGLTQVVADQGDFTLYPPLSLGILWLQGLIEALVPPSLRGGNTLLIFLIKIVPIVADVVLAWVIARLVRERGPVVSVAAAACICFNPAFWFISSFWGQSDSVPILISVVAMALLVSRRIEAGWIGYTAALLFKLQPIALAPLFGLTSLRLGGLRRTVAGMAIGAAITVLSLLPWLVGGGLGTYVRLVTRLVPRLDPSALNFWYVLLFREVLAVPESYQPTPLPFSAHTIGLVIVLALGLATAAVIAWRPEAVGLALPAAVLTMAPYIFLTGMHERYLLPVVAFLLLAAAGWDGGPRSRWLWLAFAAVSATELVNLLVVSPPFGNAWPKLFSVVNPPHGRNLALTRNVALLAAVVNVVVFVWIFGWMVRAAASWRAPASDPGAAPLREAAAEART